MLAEAWAPYVFHVLGLLQVRLRCPASGCGVVHTIEGIKLMSITVILFLTLAALYPAAQTAAFAILRFGAGNADIKLGRSIALIGDHMKKTKGPRHDSLKPVPWALGPMQCTKYSWVPVGMPDRASAINADKSLHSKDRTWVRNNNNFFTDVYLDGVQELAHKRFGLFLRELLEEAAKNDATVPGDWDAFDKAAAAAHPQTWASMVEAVANYIRLLQKRVTLRNASLSRLARYIYRLRAENEGHLPSFRPRDMEKYTAPGHGLPEGDWPILKVRRHECQLVPPVVQPSGMLCPESCMCM